MARREVDVGGGGQTQINCEEFGNLAMDNILPNVVGEVACQSTQMPKDENHVRLGIFPVFFLAIGSSVGDPSLMVRFILEFKL